MSDVSNEVTAAQDASINPTQAVEAFDVSKFTDISPENTYNDVTRDFLQPVPINATPRVSNFMKQNVVNAAAIEKDVDKFSDMERMWNKFRTQPERTIESSNVNRKAFDIMTYDNGLNQMSSITNDIERDFAVDSMVDSQMKLGELSRYDKEDDFWINAAPMTAGVFVQMADAVRQNKNLALGSAAGGLAAGGPVGAVLIPLMTTSAKDNFELTAGEIYKSAYMDLPEEEKLKADRVQTMHIALGAASISAGIEFLSVGALVKTGKEAFAKSKVLQNLSKKTIIEGIKKGVSKSTALSALAEIGKTLSTQFVEQGTQEYLQQVIQDSAKVVADPTKNLTGQEFWNIATSKDAAMASMIGTFAGVTTDVTLRVVNTAYGTIRMIGDELGESGAADTTPFGSKPKAPESDIKTSEAELILSTKLEADKARLDELKKVVTDVVEIKKQIKDSEVKEQVSSDIMTDTKFYMSRDAIEKMEKKTKGFIDAFERLTGNKLTDENEIYSMPGSALTELFIHDEAVMNGVQERPDSLNLNDYAQFKKALTQNRELIGGLLQKKRIEQLTPEQDAEVNAEINKIVESSMDGVHNVPTYVDRPLMSDTVRNMLTKSEVESFEKSIKAAREEVAKQVKAEAIEQQQKDISLDVQVAMEDSIQAIENAITESNSFRTEEAFDPQTPIPANLVNVIRSVIPEYQNMSDASIAIDIKSKHKTTNKSFSILALDPSTVPPEYQGFVNRDRTKAKRIFVRGGLDFKYADIIASQLGFDSVDSFLRDVYQVETKEEYRARRYDEELKVQYEMSSADLALTKDDMLNAFANEAKIKLQEAYTLFQQETSDAMKLVKRVGKPLRPLKQLVTTSAFLTYSLKTRDLDPQIYKANQGIFRQKAAQAVTRGEFFEFFQYKEKEALNTLVEGNVIRLRKVIESRVARVKRLSTRQGMETLYAAGPEYVEAFTALKTALSGKPFETSQVQNMLKIYEPYIQMGAVLPESLLKVSAEDAKVQQGDLTAQETLALLDTMISIHAIAKDVAIFKTETKVLDMLGIESFFADDLRPRKEYDPNNSQELEKIQQEPNSASFEAVDKANEFLRSFSSAILNYFTSIENKLDRGNKNGDYSQILIKPVMKSINRKNQLKTIRVDYMAQKLSETIGVEKFEKEYTKPFFVDELKNRFSNGFVTKFDLMSMIGHMGNESGKRRILRDLQITEEQMIAVLNKYTTAEDLRFVESMQNYYDSYNYKNIKDRAERMGMAPPEKIIGTPYVLHGKLTNGGYWPLTTESNLKDKAVDGMKGWVDVLKTGQAPGKLYTSDINTMNGHEEARKRGATSKLVYSYEAFIAAMDEMEHHEAFSETMIDLGKLFGNRSIVNDLVNVMGVNDVLNMMTILKNLGSGTYQYDIAFQQQLNGAFNTLNQNLYTAFLGFGVKTGVKQFLSLPPMVDTLSQSLKNGLGKNNLRASRLILEPMLRMMFRPREFGQVVQGIALKDAQFKNYVDKLGREKLNWFFKLDETLDVEPTNNNKYLYKWKNFQEASLSHLTAIQLYLNTGMYLGAYNAAMNGEVNGIPANDTQAANLFAGQLVRQVLSDDSALGQSALQQSDMGKLIFFAQNQLNLVTNLFMGAAQRAGIEFKNKQYQATGYGWLGAVQTMIAASIAPAALTVLIGSLWSSMVDDEDKPKTIEEYTAAILWNSTSVHPLMRNFSFSGQLMNEYNIPVEKLQMGNPYFDVLSDGAKYGAFLVNWALTPEQTINPKQRKEMMELFARLAGVPRVNFIPTPLDPKGQALTLKLFESITGAAGDIEGLASYDTSQINPIVELSGEPQANKTIAEMQKMGFAEIVEALKDPKLNADQKLQLEGYRDILYSVNGVTNPEGNFINTNRYEIDLGKSREELTMWVDGIARFETGGFRDFTSPSGASGYFHFTKGTWNSLREKYPDLRLPDSPELASKATQYNIYWKFLGENLAHLNQLKQPWTLDNIYLIHMMGYSDFKTFTEALPDQDLTDVLPTQFKWNGGVMEGKNPTKIREDVIKKLAPHVYSAGEFMYQENLLTLD